MSHRIGAVFGRRFQCENFRRWISGWGWVSFELFSRGYQKSASRVKPWLVVSDRPRQPSGIRRPLEEVGLALQRNHFHEVERVGRVVFVAELASRRSATNSMYWLIVGVHADQADREGVADELLLDVDRVADNLLDRGLRQLDQVARVEQASGRSALVAGNELIEKLRPGSEAALLEPEDGAKLPLKKMPSTAAKATMRSAKLPFSIHSRAQSAFFLTQSRVSMALKSLFFSSLSLM